MADITVTSTAVIGSGKTADHIAGATIAAGEVVFLEAATNTVKLADNDSATAEVRSPLGFALNGGTAGQPIEVLKDGFMTMNAALTTGVPVFLSGTPGKICPFADLATGDYPTMLGYAQSTTVLKVEIVEAGVVLA